MREIKFRGKRVDNGEWVYGGYAVESNNRICITMPEETKDGLIDWFKVVIPGTVGQFTGLKGCNEIEIYEGDIIRMHQFLFDGNEYENMLIGKIIYQKETMSYCLANLSNEQIQEYMGYKDDYTGFQKECVPFDCFYGLHEDSFEVIGNIHDNPEILGEE
jgi:uncharacterized phage protein (TIGR01671 family)